jgi:hypothetical protein
MRFYYKVHSSQELTDNMEATRLGLPIEQLGAAEEETSILGEEHIPPTFKTIRIRSVVLPSDGGYSFESVHSNMG